MERNGKQIQDNFPQNIARLWAYLYVKSLSDFGITHFYISPGMRNAPIVAAINYLKSINSKIVTYICVDERAAAFRALGYSKYTQTPSVLICTSGTALANYFPAVIEAYETYTPLIILSADRPKELVYSGDAQAINQTEIFGKYVPTFFDIGAASENILPQKLTNLLSRAIQNCFDTKKPAHLNLQLRAPLDGTPQELSSTYLANYNKVISKNIRQSIQINTSLQTDINFSINENDLIVIGELNSIQERKDILDTLKDIPTSLYVDIASGLKPYLKTTQLPINPQKIIRLGGPIISKRQNQWLESSDSTFISFSTQPISKDPLNLFEHQQITSYKQIKFKSSQTVPGNKLTLTAEQLTDFSTPVVCQFLSENIQTNSILFLGNSTTIRAFDQFYSNTPIQTISTIVQRGVSGIEGNLAGAMGAQDASLELLEYEKLNKRCYVVLGDISLIHDFNSLFMMAQFDRPITVIVLNDNQGSIFSLINLKSESDFIDDISSPHKYNFHMIVQKMGIEAVACQNMSELKNAFKLSNASLKPYFIECKINKNNTIKDFETQKIL